MRRAHPIARVLIASLLLASGIGMAAAQDTVENPLPPTRQPSSAEAPPTTKPELTTGTAEKKSQDNTEAKPAEKPVAKRKEMTLPRILAATVAWDDVRAALTAAQSADAAAGKEPLTRLNAAVDPAYRDVARSPVPVLLPLDTGAILRGTSATLPALQGDAANFKPQFFFAGPAGYDVAFTLTGAITNEVARFEKKEDPLLLLSGFAMLYDLPPAMGEAARPVKELEPLFPGIRRRLLESHVRYSFEKFGVPYTVSMLCFDGRAHARWVTCREADRIIEKFIKSLQVAGGTPQPIAAQGPNTIERPAQESPDFTFAAPGRLIEKTGFKGFDGRDDWTVYAKIRFPLAAAPAFANSQSFMNWGNCDFTGKTSKRQTKGAPYRCKINDKPLVFDESAPENRAYPWRDNFCEHRRFFVGQCPGGEGHQGQDIRPANCKLFNDGADRCLPFHDEVVAVRDGMILRVPKRESLYLVVNTPGEHLRFRYLHMHPDMLDAAGLIGGRQVVEGELLGKAGNFDRIPNGTSYHLHFEIQVPTRDGWVFVNPYATLIGAYERLIGARGSEFVEPERPAPAPEAAKSAVPVAAASPGAAPAAKIAEKPARRVRAAKVKTRAARGAANAILRPSDAGVPILTHGIKTGESSKESKGDRQPPSKSRRTEAACKTASAGRRGNGSCQPRAAKPNSGANGV